MRNMIMLLMLAIASRGVLAGEASSFADDPKIRVIQSGDILKVIYVNSKPTDVRVSLLNEVGAKVFSEKIRNHRGFVRPYNLSNLEEGIYKIAIEHGGDKFEGQIACVHREPEPSSVRETEFLPHVCFVPKPDKKERYLLSVPCSGQDKLTVTIFGEHGEVMHANTYTVAGDFAKVFRIENKEPGEVTIQVANQSGKVRRFYSAGNGQISPMK